jgi:hypothetical protein
MNDLQLLDKFCETCLDYVHPLIIRDIEARGLLWVVNRGLPNNTHEAKAVIRARLSKVGKCFGDPEIDQIANEIQRLETLRNKLNGMSITDANNVAKVLTEMQSSCEYVLSYFKPGKQF